MSPKKRIIRPVKLTPHILARLGRDFKTMILETIQGEYTLDIEGISELIGILQRTQEFMEHLSKRSGSRIFDLDDNEDKEDELGISLEDALRILQDDDNE